MYHLSVVVVPNASKTEIVGWQEGALKIRLAAPPVDGKANEELCHFLAKTLGIAPSLVEIEKGMAGKKKRVSLPMSEEDVKNGLGV
ncbi:DUF167 domain-containing protein [Patescibacteria group bacterium]|nr:DUF167 domain-containing protein [Patescibacteria group bacterium]MBP9709857.1 DUF167 domain-containing protein [Patescibacteria group bacterium]